MGFSSSASLATRILYLLPDFHGGSPQRPMVRYRTCLSGYSLLFNSRRTLLGADKIGKLRECFPNEIEGCLPEWGQGQFEVNLHHSDPVKMADTSVMLQAGDEADCVSSRVHGDVHGKVSRRFVGMFGPHPHEHSRRPSPRSPYFSTRISRSVSATRSEELRGWQHRRIRALDDFFMRRT